MMKREHKKSFVMRLILKGTFRVIYNLFFLYKCYFVGIAIGIDYIFFSFFLLLNSEKEIWAKRFSRDSLQM